MRRTFSIIALLAASVQTGCGSTANSASRFPNATPASTVAAPSQPSTTTTTSTTAMSVPSSIGPPSFVVKGTTQEGDQVTLEGRLGRALPASESDVDQTALSSCPAPANDGRAMVVRLDLTATLESSLSGKVNVVPVILREKTVRHQPINFVMGYNQGASCAQEAETDGTTGPDLGTVQPHQSARFTMWVVLTDAITPADPHPSEKTLGNQDWLIAIPLPWVNGHGIGPEFVAHGARVVHCHEPVIGGESNRQYLAVVDHTTKIQHGECPEE